MFCLEMYARTQYTHKSLRLGAQPALCVLVHAGWIQGFGGPGHIAGLRREISYGVAARGDCASPTVGLTQELGGGLSRWGSVCPLK